VIESKSMGIKVFSCVVIIVFTSLFLYEFISYINEVIRRYTEFPNYSLLKDDRMVSLFGLSYFIFLVIVITGFGMLMLKKWARSLYLILISFVGLGYILFLIIDSSIIAITIPSFVIIFSIYFLNHPKILEQFKEQG